MSALSNVHASTLLNTSLRSGTYYLALFLTDPTASGTGTEVSGGGYARKIINFIIDTEHMTVTLNGANIIDRVSDDSAFFKLQPGENDIIVEGGTTADVKILWKDRWL